MFSGMNERLRSLSDTTQLDKIVCRIILNENNPKELEGIKGELRLPDGSLCEIGLQLKNFNPDLFLQLFGKCIGEGSGTSCTTTSTSATAAATTATSADATREGVVQTFSWTSSFIRNLHDALESLRGCRNFNEISGQVKQIGGENVKFKSADEALSILLVVYPKISTLLGEEAKSSALYKILSERMDTFAMESMEAEEREMERRKRPVGEISQSTRAAVPSNEPPMKKQKGSDFNAEASACGSAVDTSAEQADYQAILKMYDQDLIPLRRQVEQYLDGPELSWDISKGEQLVDSMRSATQELLQKHAAIQGPRGLIEHNCSVADLLSMLSRLDGRLAVRKQKQEDEKILHEMKKSMETENEKFKEDIRFYKLETKEDCIVLGATSRVDAVLERKEKYIYGWVRKTWTSEKEKESMQWQYLRELREAQRNLLEAWDKILDIHQERGECSSDLHHNCRKKEIDDAKKRVEQAIEQIQTALGLRR
jgi:hypothetical protein